MLQLADVQQWKECKNLKNGNGTVYISEESEEAGDVTVSYIHLPPHTSIGMHTSEKEEIYFLVEGHYMRVGGHICYEIVCFKDKPHNCVNDSDEDIYVRVIRKDKFEFG